MYIFLLLLVVLASGYYLLMPFMQQEGFGMPVFRFSSNGGQDLEYNKHMLLQEIKDIEFDYDTGKLDTTDYHELSREYKLRAAALLRQMDTGAKHNTPSPEEVNFCSHCGDAVVPGAKFCAFCGSPVIGGDQ